MSDATEQRQILDMLSDGKIGPDNAERLLARLTEIGPEHIAQPGQRLRVISHTEDGNDVDISIKQQVYRHLSAALGDATRESLRLMKESQARADFAEGVKSFVEKRPPRFARVTTC